MIKISVIKIYLAVVNKNHHKLKMIYFKTLKLKQKPDSCR